MWGPRREKLQRMRNRMAEYGLEADDKKIVSTQGQ
jgi:hypothetical protein